MHAVLRREGVRMGRKRVERLMREADIAGISPRRGGFTRRDPKATLAPDLIRRDFTPSAPNRLWATDLTVIATGEGTLWLSAIRDVPSRRVVAWETSARADADLVLSTLEYASLPARSSPDSSFTVIHLASKGAYDVPRVHAELRRLGRAANHKRVERIMLNAASPKSPVEGTAH
ncbi:IS3 family transposase [Streptomyces sp. ME18-1-4]|uniref:IS3 family transposase n=1 Tax=Streptomyces sp. ME18-1-4 TaxID=3028685 RepID=UPI0029A1A311|nr:IS3 family transposase [Streptomyces sp. ME18-1-4]MDX3246000.1 IS3 family transposase [Streptomyces sp. ME18-1-4]